MNQSHEGPIEEAALRAEIQDFETHLARIAGDDDCAYDKARIRTYEALLHERRRRLDNLIAAHQGR
jgi:hypothetical protein